MPLMTTEGSAARPPAPAPATEGEWLVLTGDGATPAIELLLRAVAARATDVHLDPFPEYVEVRFRVDGRLMNNGRLEPKAAAALLSQFKLMADLDIAEPFRAKEGRLRLPDILDGYQVRITTTRVVAGEAAALRILDGRRLRRSLDTLGFSPAALTVVRGIVRHGEGLILVTGPTNSGKTTTAYSMLHELDDGERNIVTIEDPVEFAISSFRQMGVDPRHNVTMSTGLRTLLRMDPDVVLVGEIRDAETADIAMRAASSGKRVLSTFHTRDVPSTVTALRDLHADNRSLAGNLAGVISQRLLRRVCRDCCRMEPLSEEERQSFVRAGREIPDELPRAVGCPHCRGTGYFERIGVFEVVAGFPAISQAIAAGATEDELRVLLREAGVYSLTDDALEKTAQGLTTVAEVESMTWANVAPLPEGGNSATLSPPALAERLTPSDRELAYRVVIFAAADDPQVVRDRLVEELGMHPTDAMIHAQRAPGILPELLSREAADHLASAINRAGVHAEAVPQREIPDFEHAEAVHHVRSKEDGLEIMELHGGTESLIAWSDVELIAVGRVQQEIEEHLIADTPVFSYRRLTPDERFVRHLAGPELWLIACNPLRPYRIDHSRMNYEYLGERKTGSATHNFRCFVEDLVKHALGAYITPSTRAFIGLAPTKHYEFDSSDDLRRYAVFHLLVRRRAEQQSRKA